jgi:hypothetical protein
MFARKTKVLLIGSPVGYSHLAHRLGIRECECWYVASYREACPLLKRERVDLVLSPIRLRHESLYPLTSLLDGSRTTLFYYIGVENGCWWLPALRCGENCFGASALRPREFLIALDQALEDIWSSMHKATRIEVAFLPSGRIGTSLISPIPPIPPIPPSSTIGTREKNRSLASCETAAG